MDHELIVIKPDAVRRGLVGEILSRFEKKGFVLERMKSLEMTEEQARKLYSVHRDKPFFENLVKFMCDGTSIAIVLNRYNAITVTRRLIGANNLPGTIRGDYATGITENVIHASDNSDQLLWETHALFGD